MKLSKELSISLLSVWESAYPRASLWFVGLVTVSVMVVTPYRACCLLLPFSITPFGRDALVNVLSLL